VTNHRHAGQRDVRLAERFEAERQHLRAVAYRMLGSVTEADDVVQQAWLRLRRSDEAQVQNLRAWLTTVVARLCLDELRSRKSRREELVGLQLPEPVISAPDAENPEQQALLADSVGMAMLVVLDTLSPPERLAFVLHDVFGVPFEEIAPIVGRSSATTRQLASRARRRVRGARAKPSTSDMKRMRMVVDAFFAAARAGDFDALVATLDPDVVVRGEIGQLRVVETRGAHEAASQALMFRRLAPGARSALVSGEPGVVVFADGRPFAVMAFTVAADRITEIYVLGNPDRLQQMDFSVLDS